MNTAIGCALLVLLSVSPSFAGSRAIEGFSLRGRVSGAERMPAEVAVVSVDDVQIGHSVMTGYGGAFDLGEFAEGTYILRAVSGSSIARKTVHLPANHDVMLRLAEAPSGAGRTAPLVNGGGPGGRLNMTTVLEDFEDGSIADYTSVGSIVGGVSTLAAHDGARGLNITEQVFPGWIYKSNGAIAVGETVSAWFRPGSGGRTYLGFGSTSAGTYALAVGVNTSSLILQYVPYGAQHEEITQVPFVWIPGKWYRLEATWSSSTAVSGRVFDSNGTSLLAQVSGISALFPGGSSGGFAWRGFGGSHAMDTLFEGGGGVVTVPAMPMSWLITLVLGATAVGTLLLRRRG